MEHSIYEYMMFLSLSLSFHFDYCYCFDIPLFCLKHCHMIIDIPLFCVSGSFFFSGSVLEVI